MEVWLGIPIIWKGGQIMPAIEARPFSYCYFESQHHGSALPALTDVSFLKTRSA
jgi:hypothetical protein